MPPPGKYLVRVTWNGGLQAADAQLKGYGSNKAWFAPLEDVVRFLKYRKAYLNGVGFDASSVNSAKAGDYSIIVYRTEDVKSSLVVPTEENLVRAAKTSSDSRLRAYANEPKEFWDKVFALDFKPHLKKINEAKLMRNPDEYIQTLPKDLQEPMRARILMCTKMGVNETYSHKISDTPILSLFDNYQSFQERILVTLYSRQKF